MKSYSSLKQCFTLSSLLFLGCNTAVEQQKNALKAEEEAKQEIEDVNIKAQDKVAEVRAEANKEVAEAQANFLKLREDFRHSTTENLVGLDKNIAEMEAEAATLKGKAREEYEAKLVAIRVRREQFSRDFQAIADESASTWDATKSRLEKSWAELKKSVDDAD